MAAQPMSEIDQNAENSHRGALMLLQLANELRLYALCLVTAAARPATALIRSS